MTTRAEQGATSKTGVNWADPSIPAGDSPPLPAWPLWIAILLWAACAAFLVMTAMSR